MVGIATVDRLRWRRVARKPSGAGPSSDGSSSPYAPLVSLVGAVTGGLDLRRAVRERRVPAAPQRAATWHADADGFLGALLSAAIALGLAWIVGAVALQTPGVRQLRRDIQRSEILQRLNAILPPSRSSPQRAGALRPVPRTSMGPRPTCRRRARRSRAIRTCAAVAGSVVRILGNGLRPRRGGLGLGRGHAGSW